MSGSALIGDGTRRRNAALVRLLVAQAWNAGSLALADEILAPGYLLHTPAGTLNREQWRQSLLNLRASFPDCHLSIDDLLADDERVGWRWTMQGTDEGGVAGRPPTGRRIVLQGINVEHIAAGRIVESWSMADYRPVLRTLGLFGDSWH